MPDLETVDLIGVEILSTGGPVFGKGSPPEGDFWTADDLRAMADADAELGDEIKPPAKIGHSDAQRLLGLTDGEMPAVGWIENVRMSDDGSKLVADLLRVPRKFADLVEAGGYRTRSVELAKVTSQKTGKVYDWVVTGLAWLGGKLPAVKTLDDVVALYEDRGVDLPELQRVVVYEQPADGTVVWKPETSLQQIRNDLQEALNPAGVGGPQTLWVCDVSSDGVALVSAGYDDGDAFVVPYRVADDGTVTAAAQSEWVKAERTWVATSKQYADRAYASWTTKYVNGLPDSAFLYIEPGGKKDSDGKTLPRSNRHFPVRDANGDVDLPHVRNALARIPQSDLPQAVKDRAAGKARKLLDAASRSNEQLRQLADGLLPGRFDSRADTRPRMPAFTAEQRKTFAEATGLDEANVTDEMLTAAGLKAETEEPGPEERALEERVETTERELADTKRQLAAEIESARVERRRSFVEGLMRDGKIEPGQREVWEKAFDTNEDSAAATAGTLRANEDLAREFGADDGDTETEQTDVERAFEDDLAARMGVDKEALI